MEPYIRAQALLGMERTLWPERVKRELARDQQLIIRSRDHMHAILGRLAKTELVMRKAQEQLNQLSRLPQASPGTKV